MSSPLKRRRVPQGSVPALLALLTAAPSVVLIAPPALAQSSLPRQATVTSAKGKQVTLGIGSDDGARKGAIFTATTQGRERARLQITEVRRTESTAQLLSVEADYVLTVGDTVNFVEVSPLPVTPSVPTTPSPTVNPAPQPAPKPVTPPVVKPAPQPKPVVEKPKPMPKPVAPKVMPVSMASPAIASLNGANATLNVGAARGVKAGSTLPVMRDGNVVALVRVTQVTPDGATGTVVWRDDAAALRAGDAVALAGGGAMQIEPGVPAAAIRMETGASNIGVPNANREYLYLAGLAASGLITSQPAHVFNDEGARRHRTAEDFTFTRAQIAGFILEALASPKAADPSDKTRVALGSLINEYDRELRKLGASDAQLAPFAQSKGFEFGISGQQRATLIGGDRNGYLSPFGERQGGLRTRSGIDTRTNIWARSGNVSFLGSIDAGTDPLTGVDDRNFLVRRAVLAYNANKLLRGLTIEAGRDELWVGPGHFGTLALGDTAGPVNMLRAKFKRGSYQAEGIYAPLGRGPRIGQGGSQRALYVQHAYVNLGSQTRIGVIESALDPNNAFDPALFVGTFTPLALGIAQRLQSNEDSNLNGQVYIETSMARGLRAYGELLVDDIGANNNNRVRNRMGTLIGAHVFLPKNPTKLGAYAEWANLQGRTYLRLSGTDPDYDYYYRGFPLGYPVAPLPGLPQAGNIGLGGAESLRFESYWRPTRRLRLNSGLEFADLNSERLDLARQQTIRLRASYDLNRSITLTARAQRVSTSQPGVAAAVRQKLLALEIARAF